MAKTTVSKAIDRAFASAVAKLGNDAKFDKNKRVEFAIAVLDYLKIRYAIYNKGLHFAIDPKSHLGAVDFWPTTGRWIVGSTGDRGRGLSNLAELILVSWKKR